MIKINKKIRQIEKKERVIENWEYVLENESKREDFREILKFAKFSKLMH